MQQHPEQRWFGINKVRQLETNSSLRQLRLCRHAALSLLLLRDRAGGAAGGSLHARNGRSREGEYLASWLSKAICNTPVFGPDLLLTEIFFAKKTQVGALSWAMVIKIHICSTCKDHAIHD